MPKSKHIHSSCHAGSKEVKINRRTIHFRCHQVLILCLGFSLISQISEPSNIVIPLGSFFYLLFAFASALQQNYWCYLPNYLFSKFCLCLTPLLCSFFYSATTWKADQIHSLFFLQHISIDLYFSSPWTALLSISLHSQSRLPWSSAGFYLQVFPWMRIYLNNNTTLYTY